MRASHPATHQPNYFRQSLVYAPIGLVLTGFGLSLFGEALTRKQQKTSGWVLWGTLSLVVFNTGLSFVGQAVKRGILHELKRDEAH